MTQNGVWPPPLPNRLIGPSPTMIQLFQNKVWPLYSKMEPGPLLTSRPASLRWQVKKVSWLVELAPFFRDSLPANQEEDAPLLWH